MHSMLDQKRHAAPSEGAGAQPSQPAGKLPGVWLIFDESHQEILLECAAAAREIEQANRKRRVSSATESLMAQVNIPGTPVTRPAPEAQPDAARSQAPQGGAAQGDPDPGGAEAPPQSRAEAQSQCVAIIDDDDRVDAGPETPDSGDAPAATPQSALAQGTPGPGGAAAPPQSRAEAQSQCVAIIDDDDCVDADPETPDSGDALAATPQSTPAQGAPGPGGAEAPPQSRVEAQSQCVAIIDDDDDCVDFGPQASSSGDAPAVPPQSAPAQGAPAPGGAAAPPQSRVEAQSQCILIIDDDDCIDFGPQASSSGDAQTAPPQTAPAQGDSPPGGAEALPHSPVEAQSQCVANIDDDDRVDVGPETPDSGDAQTAPPQAEPAPAASPQAAPGQALEGISDAEEASALAEVQSAAIPNAALRSPNRDAEPVERDRPAVADAPRPPEAAAIPAQQSASQRRCAAMRAGAVREVFGLTAADMERHDPNRSPAGGAAAQRGGAGGALPEQRRESRAGRGPDPALACAAGPGGDWRTQAQALSGGGPFDGPWDDTPNDCGAPDRWEADGRADDCGAPDHWETDGRADDCAPDGWEADGKADDFGAPDRREADGGADGVAECGAAPDGTAGDAGGRRRGGPRLGRWSAAILLVATAAAAMVWPGGSGIERFSDWRNSQPVPAQRGAPQGGTEEIRRMVADALNGAPGETAPPADAAPGVWPDDGAQDLRHMVADALNGAPGETAPPADAAPGVWPDDGAQDLRHMIADALNGAPGETASPADATPGVWPDDGAEDLRHMAADALNGAPGETASPADAAPGVWPDDGAEDLRGMIADARNEDRVPDGSGYGPAESAHEGGADAPGVETAAAAGATDPASAAGTAKPVDPLDVRLAQIERRLGDAERGAVSTGGLIGTLSAAIADAAARMEAIERDRASMESRLADLELRAAETGRAEDWVAKLVARLDETDTVVLDIAARVAALEAETQAGAVAMADGPGDGDAPGWIEEWGPDPFAADGPRTQWDNSVDDNPVYRRIPAAARLVRDKDGRIIPEFVETPAGGTPSAAPPQQGG